MSVFSKIKKWLTKKPKNEKIKEANRVTNYGGGASSKSVQKEVKRSIVKAEAKKRGEKQTEYQKSVVSKSSSSAFKATPPSVRKAEAKDRQTSKKSDPFNAKNAFKASAQPKFTHQSTALGTMSKRDIDTRTAKMNAYNENRKYQSRAADALKPLIDEKYSTRKGGVPAYIKQGNYAADPDVAKYNVLKHPIATSATRGGLSGATFGLSELGIALLPKSKEAEEAERLYQANKSKGAEFAGEMAGSLVGFGLTSGASKAAVTKLAPKTTARLGESATEYLAKNGLVRRAAEKEALRKLGTTATKEEIEHFARSKAAKLVAALGEDAAINLTTGAVSDVSHAIIDSDNPVEFLKNMGMNAVGNVVLGGVTSAVPALRGGNVDDAFVRNRLAAREGLDDLMKRNQIGINRTPDLMPPKVSATDRARFISRANKANQIDEGLERINIRDMARPSAQNIDAQVDDALDELIESATTTEDFMNFFGLDRATAEILAKDRAEQASKKAVDAVSEVTQNGISKGNIKPLAENLRTNKEIPRSRNREWRATPRSAKRVDTSIEGMTKQLDELKGKSWKTDRERRAIETKINDVEDRLNRAKWRREGGADMQAMQKAYRGEYAGFDMGKYTNSYQSDVLEGKIKGKTATIVEMSPDEYMERTYRQIFKKPTERGKAFSGIPETQKDVEKYAEAMRNGEQFPLPYLDYSAAQQEGRHRALAAKAAGIDKIPVVIIDDEANPKAIINEVAEATAKAEAPKVETPKTEIEPKAETTVKAEPPKRKPTKTEIKRDELRKEYQALQERYEAAKNAGEDTSDIVTDMQETDLLIKDAERKIAKADKARETRAAKKAAKATEESADNAQINLEDEIGEATKKAESGEQITLDDAVKAVEERQAKPQTEVPKTEAKAEKPKTVKQRKIEEQNERNAIDNVMRKREEKLASGVREQTGGEYSYRQGEHTAAEHGSIDEARRIDAEQKKVYKQLQDDNVKEMFTDENTPFGVFKTANKAEMKKAAEEATARVRDDTYSAIRRLVDKADRLKSQLTEKSALASAEHITLDDIADITAIRNIYEEAGEKLPAEYEEAFSHVIEWQRTEAAQMLKSVDLFLKENDREYRRVFISRDVDRYLRKVLNADDKAIADIKRSLDKNHGEGYFDKMIQALSEFKGSKNEAAFRKAYADFQAEIFMNTKPTVWDTVNLWRHTFMLSSPKTGANNVIGNIMQRAMYNISDAMNMAGESVARAVNKDVKRTTAILKTGDQRRLANMFTSGRLGEHNLKNGKYLKGFKDQAFADAINDAASADVGEMMESSKYMGDVIKGLKYKPETVGGKVKQGFVKGGRFGSEYVSIMLNEPDSWFVERNYRSALLKYLEANGVNSSKSLVGNEKLLKEARAYAKDVALENTYKKANNVVSFLEGLRKKGHTKGSNVGYKSAAIMLDAELPYLKVPANLIVNNFKYSPLGLGKGAIDAFRGAVKGDAELLNKATRELSKGLTGTGMALLGYMMFCQDQADENSWGFIGNAKDELKEYGVRDNSFKIGDHNYNIANMGIGSVQFLMGAALAEDLADKGAIPSYQVAFDAINKTVDTVADMSLMENAVSLLDAFGNGGDYNATVSDRLGRAATEIAGDYAAQFVPNPMRGIAKGYTDADLDTGVKKGDTSKVHRIVERNVNNFVQGVPVVNEKVLPHKVDTHGNLVNERKTKEEKRLAAINNTLNPLSPRKVNIPEVDKEELKVKKENGDPFKPNGFDPNREYKLKVGEGKRAETIDLTGKEREQIARSAKNAGFDMMDALVKKGMFGDRLGDRAQKMLKDVPDDEEEARKLIFSTKEWKNADNETKNKYLEIMYGQGKRGDSSKGVSRTRKAEAYIGIGGNSEGDFRYQNDLDWHYQQKYEDNNFADKGIDKGKWADVVQSVYDASHKWDDENKKNVDTPNSAYKVKLGILAVEGLTREQRVAIYQAYRGKRNGFGWYDWDGESVGGGYYRRGWHRWHRWGSYQRKGRKPSNEMPSGFKAKKANISGGSKVSAPNVSGGINTKGTASRMSTSPKINITPLDIKTVRANSGKSRRSSNDLAAALEDIKKTESKVKPPKARR